MSASGKSITDLYWEVAELWRGNEVDSGSVAERLLEMIALCHGRALRPDKLDFAICEDDELTHLEWTKLRATLDRKLGLPDSGAANRIADRTPGLIERTRRLVCGARDTVLLKNAFGELLHFIAASDRRMDRFDGAHFRTPLFLAQLISALLGKPGSEPTLVPLDSSGWLGLLLAENGRAVCVEARNSQAIRTYKLLACLADWDLEATPEESAESKTRFRYSAAITTFGLRHRHDPTRGTHTGFRFLYGEADQIGRLLSKTSETALVVVPENFLFRTTGGERLYKEQLIRKGLLAAAIRLPRLTFAPTSNVQTSLLVFDMLGETSDVMFIDASGDRETKLSVSPSGAGGAIASLLGALEDRRRKRTERVADLMADRRVSEFSAIASYEEIAERDFNISVDRYVRDERAQYTDQVLTRLPTVELGTLAEVIRPQSFPPAESEEHQTFAEVSLQDIRPDGSISYPKKRVQVDDRSFAKVVRHSLNPGDVLVSVRGRIGDVGIVGDDAIEPGYGTAGMLAAQAFVIVRLRERSPMSPLALYRYLASPIGESLLKALASGTSVPMVSIGDVKRLRVVIPTQEEQRDIEGQHQQLQSLRAEIANLEKEIQARQAMSWPMTVFEEKAR